MTMKVMACVDHSEFSFGVGDHAAWAAERLNAPLEFLHVIDRHPEKASTLDLSGSIGLGGRENLLADLVEFDQKRSKLAQENGRALLDALRHRVQRSGIPALTGKQVHGELGESLSDIEPEVRLFVMGKGGQSAEGAEHHVGGSLDRVIRLLRRPVLLVPPRFAAPTRVLLAFDGSQNSRRGIEQLAGLRLLVGLPCWVLMTAVPSSDSEQQLNWAKSVLSEAGIEATGSVVQGQQDALVRNAIAAHDLNFLVLGGYSRSRVRDLLTGSAARAVIRAAQIPLLLFN